MSKPLPDPRRAIRAVAEGEAAAPEEDQAAETVVAAETKEEEGATVAVPLSPSDLLTMYFQVRHLRSRSKKKFQF